MTRARETSENARQAKAWVNFDGTFGSSPFTLANGGIRGAFNVSSVTDLGTGRYTVNFTAEMSDVNYTAFVTSAGDSTTFTAWQGANVLDTQYPRSVSAVSVGLWIGGGGVTNRTPVDGNLQVAIFR